MATATTNQTSNYGLSQYTANDPVKFLTNYNSDMSAIDTNLKVVSNIANGAVPTSRTIAGLDLSTNRTVAELIAKGLASGDVSGDANNALKLSNVLGTSIIDATGNALNALKLGGINATNYPTISSGTWTILLKGVMTAGTPTYSINSGTYCKVGKLISISGTVTLSAKGGIVGNLYIQGLPFAPANDSSFAITNVSGISGISGAINAQISHNNTDISIGSSMSTSGFTWDVTDTKITDSFSFNFSTSYITN